MLCFDRKRSADRLASNWHLDNNTISGRNNNFRHRH